MWAEEYDIDDMDIIDDSSQQDDKPLGNDTMERITRVQAQYTELLMRKPNVIGVGVGLKKRHGMFTQQPALVVLVSHKIPDTDLTPDDRIPTEIEGVPIDVQEAGFFSAQE